MNVSHGSVKFGKEWIQKGLAASTALTAGTESQAGGAFVVCRKPIHSSGTLLNRYIRSTGACFEKLVPLATQRSHNASPSAYTKLDGFSPGIYLVVTQVLDLTVEGSRSAMMPRRQRKYCQVG